MQSGGRRRQAAIFLPFLSIHPSSSRLASTSAAFTFELENAPHSFSPPLPPPADRARSVSSQFRITQPAFTILLAALGRGRGNRWRAMEAIKSSRDRRAAEIKLSTLPLPLHGGGIGFSAFHRSPTDFYFDTHRLDAAPLFLGWTRWINSFVIRDAVVKEKNSMPVSFFFFFFWKRIFGLES